MQKINTVVRKIKSSQRISKEDALFLYNNATLSDLCILANEIKNEKHGKKVYFIQNVHVEPTNYCVYKCKFCSFQKQPYEKNFFDFSWDEIKNFLEKLPKTIKEIHITGGVHPERDIYWYIKLIQNIQKVQPQAKIKAFTAI